MNNNNNNETIKVAIGPIMNGFHMPLKTIYRYLQLKGYDWSKQWFYTKVSHLDDRYKLVDDITSMNDFTDFISTANLGESVKQRFYRPNEYCWHTWHYLNKKFPRTEPELIQAIEECGETKACKVIEIPANIEWYIESDNEMSTEWIAEKHRTWR